jgi:succinoglycan biosynthesis transport protein ExoP
VNQEQPEIADFNSAAPEISGMSLGDILRTFKKHYLLILVCALVGGLIAGIYVHFATPIYEASATIRIDPNRISSLGLTDLLSASASAQDPLKTEAQILTSDAVAISALQSLPDDQFRELTGANKTQMTFPDSLKLGGQQEERLTGRAPTLTLQQEGAISRVLSTVSVKPIEDTQLLAIKVRNKNPELAATLTNHIIFAYLRNSFDSRYSSVAQVQGWLQTQLDALKTRAAQSQKRLAEFQEQNNITGTDQNNTVIQRLQMLNDRLGQAQGERIMKEAQVRAAANADINTLATLYPNVGLQALQSEQATLYSRYTELAAKFGPNYPPLAEVIVQRKQVDDKLGQVISSTRDRLRQEFEIPKTPESMLQQQFDQQTQRVYGLNSKQADYAVLQAESSASRDLFDRLQYQLQAAGITAGLNSVSTMVVNSARAPHEPVEPKKLITMSVGLVMGLFAGSLGAFLFDAVGDRLQTVSQAESVLGLHALATIPHEEKNLGPDGKRQLPSSYERAASKFSEAFRGLRNAIAFSSLDKPPRVILVTSSLAGEGKTVVSANVAIMLAQSKAKVLAVDIDLRRARLHAEFVLPNVSGLSNLLLDEGSASVVFHHPLPDLPNLSVLTAGPKVQFPSEVLSSQVFQRKVEEWRKEYDYIVFDSAPLMVVSDTLPVAKLMDAVVLVTRFDKTPMRAAQRSLAMLRRVRARVAGVVINDVPATGMEYGSYYGYGTGYYSDDPKES